MKMIKKIIAVLVVAVMPLSMAAQSVAPQNVSGDAIIKTAMQYIGVPYRRGTSSPKSFDCSGFTSYVYKNHGINLTRSSCTQFNEGEKVAKGDLRIGDLVFFQGRSGQGGVGHVGIVTEVDKEKNSFKFVHARSRGVGVDDSKMAYYQSRYVGARRILSTDSTKQVKPTVKK